MAFVYRTSILVSADIGLDGLDPKLFPGLSEDIQVHSGFADAHARSALRETYSWISFLLA